MFSPTSKKRERNSSMSDAEVVFWSSQLRRRFTARIQSCMVAKWCQVKTKDPTPPTQSARLQWPWQTFNVLSPQHSISNYAKEHCPPDGVYIFCSVQDLASCGYPPLPQTRSLDSVCVMLHVLQKCFSLSTFQTLEAWDSCSFTTSPWSIIAISAAAWPKPHDLRLHTNKRKSQKYILKWTGAVWKRLWFAVVVAILMWPGSTALSAISSLSATFRLLLLENLSTCRSKSTTFF